MPFEHIIPTDKEKFEKDLLEHELRRLRGEWTDKDRDEDIFFQEFSKKYPEVAVAVVEKARILYTQEQK